MPSQPIQRNGSQVAASSTPGIHGRLSLLTSLRDAKKGDPEKPKTPAADGLDRLDRARALLVQFIDESGDLFGSRDIHLLAGAAHAANRVRLLSLLRGSDKISERDVGVQALRDEFCSAAGISGATAVETDERFSRWLREPPVAPPTAKDEIRNRTPEPHATVDRKSIDTAASPQRNATTKNGGAEAAANTRPAATSEPQSPDVTLPTASGTPAINGNSLVATTAGAPDLNDLNPAASAQIAEWVARHLSLRSAPPITSLKLFEVADTAFGGRQASGRYSVKDAYDAMEAGINRAILHAGIAPSGAAASALGKLDSLKCMLARTPPQTRRTTEMEEFQQFSTPPTLAFAAAWVANIRAGDRMLEPSAGTGGIAIFGVLAGATVILNELSARRAAILHALLPQQRLFLENAEQLNNVLPDDVRPTVVVMNPPFSATAGRLNDLRSSNIGARHVDQALRRLMPGGRLVAIVGDGMAMDGARCAAWWSDVRLQYNVRADIGIDGRNYRKYGTTFGVRLLVIDKTGKTDDPVLAAIAGLEELFPLLEAIRNERPVIELPNSDRPIPPAQYCGTGVPATGQVRAERNAGPDADALGPGKRPDPASADAGPPGPGSAGIDDRDAGENGAGSGDRLSDQPGTPTVQRDDTRSERPGPAARSDHGGHISAGDAVQQHDRDGAVAALVVGVEARATGKRTEALSDAIYEQYVPQRLSIPGALPHPAILVQSAAMAAVEPPVPTYVPNLPAALIADGRLSLAQLEAVVYAGQAHEQHLPNGQRRGFFIGDGTGVGKGRVIAGIIVDNLRSGRGKAVWISEKTGLLRDAQRDFADVGGDKALLFAHGKTRPDEILPDRAGVIFASYTLLASGQKKGRPETATAPAKTRLQQLVAWLGAGFDGVIAMDESHNLANGFAKRGARGLTSAAAKALAGIALQDALPDARVVYVSATGATEVVNLTYAARLGLWGEGTPFAKASDFIAQIDAGGVAAMELVSRDMKAMGVYLARSLSFDGVTYERLEHTLTPLQADIYNELAGTWQSVLGHVDAALRETGQARDGAAKSSALSRFWGAHQRFFNQIVTAMQMPTVIAQARAEIAKGHAVVMQLVNTNEAAQERQMAELAASGAETDEMDFTPRQNLIDYVKFGFPVQQYEQFKDADDNIRSRPVLDAAGNPVFNKEMEAKRDALVRTLLAIRVPDNPIDTILNAFGPDAVAEVTGRSRRFVMERGADGDVRPVEQKRPASAAVADADAFMNDKRRVLVFSDAGGTGYSFHADLTRPNQRKRIHYLIQPGWRADKAVQGMGRTHRTNEASQPHYVLPTTNLEAQRRFISSIARRLDQLGALTRGQRQTGSQGLFSASDNLESDYARRALRILFNDMYLGRSPLKFGETTHAMGLTNLIDGKTGALNETKLPTIPQFLNRLLSLKTFEQDRVFGEFFQGMEHLVALAKQQGTFDHGVETIRAQSIRKTRDEVVHTDPRTGAQTHYIALALQHPTRITAFDTLPVRRDDGTPVDGFFGYFRNEKTGKVFALQKTGQSTDEHGQLITRGRHFSPTGPVRFVANLDHVAAAVDGKVTIRRRVTTPVYGGEPFSETWSRNGRSHVEHSGAAASALENGGLAGLDYLTTMPGVSAERRDALKRVVARIRDGLVDKEVEREVKAYTRLAPPDAKLAWDAEVAAAPATYHQNENLITGALLPIWDRIPGSPRVIRTQTDDGERLLGRTVAPAMLAQTLKNLGVGSSVASLTTAQILDRFLAGDKAVLANGWEIRTAKVSDDVRIEIVAENMTDGDRRILTQQGAFCERIQWRERMFIPTGESALAVLGRVLQARPAVDLFGKNVKPDDDAPLFSIAKTGQADNALNMRAASRGMPLDLMRQSANDIAGNWPNAPALRCVQSPSDLPFPAGPGARGAFHGDVVYLVADNIPDIGELQRVVAHEVFGHAGLRAVLSERDLAREMDRLRSLNPVLAHAARRLAVAHGYPMVLATEEAMADLAGGQAITGFQRLVVTVQRALRSMGLGAVADWLERKTQAETMDLLRRARRAVTHPHRAPSAPDRADGPLFALQATAGAGEAANPRPGPAPAGTFPETGAAHVEHIPVPRPDPYGLRAFGLSSLDQVRASYRNTARWRPVPPAMRVPASVRSIRAELRAVECAGEGGAMFVLDDNGNIVIVKPPTASDERAPLNMIVTLADLHGLGVLATRSAYQPCPSNERSLSEYGFQIIDASVTRAATGSGGPPNARTFARRPAGAPLFSIKEPAPAGMDARSPQAGAVIGGNRSPPVRLAANARRQASRT